MQPKPQSNKLWIVQVGLKSLQMTQYLIWTMKLRSLQEWLPVWLCVMHIVCILHRACLFFRKLREETATLRTKRNKARVEIRLCAGILIVRSKATQKKKMEKTTNYWVQNILGTPQHPPRSCRDHFSVYFEWTEFTLWYSGIKAKTIDANVRTSFKKQQNVRHRMSAFFFIAVFHSDALKSTPIRHRDCGFFYHKTAVDGLICFTVQGSVQHTLQPKVSIGFL